MSEQIAIRMPEELLERLDRLQRLRPEMYPDRASTVRAAILRLVIEEERAARVRRVPDFPEDEYFDLSGAASQLAGSIIKRAARQ